jgi:membrane protease YdiL (CAAX protease family)
MIVYPIFGYFDFKKLKSGRVSKQIIYQQTITSTLIPTIIIAITILFTPIHFSEIGIKLIDLKKSTLSNWIIIPAIVLYVLYFSYNIYSIIVLKSNKEVRIKTASALPKELTIFFPITKKEKRTWDLLAINAGITEEFIYRGYLFYSLAFIFPELSVPIILIVSTIIFGIGHIYQGFEVLKSTIVGLFLGLFYIVFDSLFPVIIIHILQDLVARDLIPVDFVENKDTL